MGKLVRSLDILFNLIEILIIVRVFMSMFRVSFDNAVGKIIYELTEPVLAPARTLLNKLGLDMGMIDFSPIVALILLRIIFSIIIRIIV